MSLASWIYEIFVMPIWDGVSTLTGDAVKPEAVVKEWRLDKFEGDPPKPGEDKSPIEYMTGGDGLPTRRYVRTDRDGFVFWQSVSLEPGNSGTN